MPADRRIDVGVLIVAGVMNVIVAPLDFKEVLLPGTIQETGGAWIDANTARWQAGWAVWLAVTLTFAWSLCVLARHAAGPPQLRWAAVGLAFLAAGVDIVGIVVNIAVVPGLAGELAGGGGVEATFSAAAELGHALTDVTAVGLYVLAAAALLPGLFASRSYPRRLAWIAAVEVAVSAAATVVLAFGLGGADQIGRELNPASVLATLAFLLYGAWAWGSAAWLWGSGRTATP